MLPHSHVVVKPMQKKYDRAMGAIIAEVIKEFGYDKIPGNLTEDPNIYRISEAHNDGRNQYWILVNKDTDELYGGCGFSQSYDVKDACVLEKFYIIPSMRSQGHGKFLLNYILDLAFKAGYTQIKLSTMSGMKSAVALYQKVGFKQFYIDAPVPHKELILFELNLVAFRYSRTISYSKSPYNYWRSKRTSTDERDSLLTPQRQGGTGCPCVIL